MAETREITVVIRRKKDNIIIKQVTVSVTDYSIEFIKQVKAWNIANDKADGANWTYEETRSVAFKCLAMSTVETPFDCYATVA